MNMNVRVVEWADYSKEFEEKLNQVLGSMGGAKIIDIKYTVVELSNRGKIYYQAYIMYEQT